MERVEEQERKQVEEEQKRAEEEERRRHEEEERQWHEEEEQHQWEEEERCQHEKEEECLRKLADFKRNEVKALMRLEEWAKAARAEKVAKKVSGEDTTGDKGMKRMRPKLELEDKGGRTLIGNMLEEDGVMWVAEDGRVCNLCQKAHHLCLWREEGSERVGAVRGSGDLEWGKSKCIVW
jgi:hypothetical protein